MNVSTNCVVTLRVESPQTHESARKFAARIKAAIEFQVVGTSVTVVSTGSPADADRQRMDALQERRHFEGTVLRVEFVGGPLDGESMDPSGVDA